MPENLDEQTAQTSGSAGQEAANPFDTSAEESELQALQAEITQAQASLEGDFAKYWAENNDTPETDELYFEDKEAFMKKVLQDQNAYLDERLRPKIQRANELGADISQKQQFGAIDSAVKAFKEKHPDVDENELMKFFNEQIPPEVQAQLQQLPPEQFFEELLALYNGVTGGAGEQAQGEEQLPQQINGVASSEGVANGVSGENPFERM
jgi:hypothetical protein